MSSSTFTLKDARRGAMHVPGHGRVVYDFPKGKIEPKTDAEAAVLERLTKGSPGYPWRRKTAKASSSSSSPATTPSTEGESK